MEIWKLLQTSLHVIHMSETGWKNIALLSHHHFNSKCQSEQLKACNSQSEQLQTCNSQSTHQYV
jgi:hypothetical protein